MTARARIAALALALAALAGPAAALAPESSPRPLPRPGAGATAVAAPTPAPVPAQRPRARPAAAPQVAEAAPALPAEAGAPPPERPAKLRGLTLVKAAGIRSQPVPEATTGRKGALCGDPAIQGSRIPPIRAKVTGCGLEDGVKVTAVDGIPLSVPVTVDCPTARALRAWVSEGVRPAVGKLGGGVARLDVASHYACRPRNNQKGEKISEHGRGRAVDITAVRLRDGAALSVLEGWGDGRHGKILKAMHRAACGPFGTVLGPAANRFHRDHFHFDTARHRNGSYCK